MLSKLALRSEKLTEENKIINEVIVCTKKYFIRLDALILELDSNIIGRNLSKLISNPIHIIKGSDLEIESKIPRVIIKKKSLLE